MIMLTSTIIIVEILHYRIPERRRCGPIQKYDYAVRCHKFGYTRLAFRFESKGPKFDVFAADEAKFSMTQEER